MKLKKIEHELISPVIHKIVDEPTINYLKLVILNYYGIVKGNDSFPGAQPISVELKNMLTIKNGNYVAGAKLDGERFFMLVCQIPKDLNTPYSKEVNNVTLLIDRTFSFYIVRQGWIHINAYAKQILLDGELTNGEFNVHDVMVVEGNNVMQRDFLTRIKLFDAFLKAGRWKPTENTNSFNIKLKKFYSIPNLNKLVKTEQFIEHSDGIVFYPVNEPVQKRTQFTLFKWKPPGHHTVDFKIINHNKLETKLITWDPKQQKEFAFDTICMVGEEYPNESIIEFNVELIPETNEVKFVPIKQRIDKSHGNSKLTIERTIHNVRENITLDKLVELLS